MGIRKGLTAHGAVRAAGQAEPGDHNVGHVGGDEGYGDATGGGIIPSEEGDLILGLVCITPP